MIDNKSERVLKAAIKLCGKDITTPISLECKRVRIPLQTLISLCNFLQNNGYIKKVSHFYASSSAVDFYLTYEGYSYFRVKRKKIVSYIGKLFLSKWSDIIVAVIAAYLTAKYLV